MNEQLLKEITNNIFKAIFNENCPYDIERIKKLYAFDIKLPEKVYDYNTKEETWTSSINSERYITNNNMEKIDNEKGWMIDKINVSSLDDIIKLWQSINLTTTERVYDSINVSQSDTIYSCENVYNSTDCSSSKNILFCDSCHKSEYALASQRSNALNNCIRCDDSNTITNSYTVICSSNVSNSLFIQDCSNLYECIFCAHISSKKYCIANMQFSEEEYYQIKKAIINWILSN